VPRLVGAATAFLARWLFYVAVFLVTLEGCARIDDWLRWGAPVAAWYSLDQLRIDGRGGPRNRPHARFQQFRINNHGFRGGDFDSTKTTGHLRVALVGASETFGLYESPGRDLSSQLQHLLDRRVPGRYQVINAGAVGMSPPRIREFFREWLRRFAIDVIVFYPTPSLYLDYQPPRDATFDVADPARPVQGPWYAPRLATKAWTLVKQQLPTALQTRLRQMMIARERTRMGVREPWTRAPDDRVALFERHVRELIADVRRDGTNVILATHAHRFTPEWMERDRDMMVGWVRFFPRATPEAMLDMELRANRTIVALGAEYAVPVADVAARVPRAPQYFADFAHFTDDGAKIAAEVLAHAVLSLRDRNRTTPRSTAEDLVGADSRAIRH
jgi:hypothetical protein